MKQLELTGQRFGHLTVIRRAFKEEILLDIYKHDAKVWWVAKCDCGNLKVAPGSRIKCGSVTSCGCKAGNVRDSGVAAQRAHFTHYRATSKRRKISFDLTQKEFISITTKACHYCGLEWSSDYCYRKRKNGTQKYQGVYRYNGIDRIDSEKGYCVENCVPSCKSCNYAKAQMTVQEFRAWVARVYQHTVAPSQSLTKNELNLKARDTKP